MVDIKDEKEKQMSKDAFREQILYVTDEIDKVIEKAIKRGIHPFVIHTVLLSETAASRGSTRETFGLGVTEKIEKIVALAEDSVEAKNK